MEIVSRTKDAVVIEATYRDNARSYKLRHTVPRRQRLHGPNIHADNATISPSVSWYGELRRLVRFAPRTQGGEDGTV